MVAISGTTIVSDKAFKINDVEISNYYDAKKTDGLNAACL